ncbi:MAG: hypothetical protein H7328_08605 [Bdellovibrio sp.]|nr:hypothetical protein [Bdellovibrio sp.]
MLETKKLPILWGLLLLLVGCVKPIGKTSLLTSGSSTCADFSCSDSSGVDASAKIALGIDNSDIVSSTDTNDTVEIAGSCTDLGRKNNRIMVQVFAGENLSVNPYIDNDISSDCQQTGNSITAGIEPSDLKTTSFVIMGPSQTFTFVASGGTAPYAFTVNSGAGTMNVSTGLYTAPVTNGMSVIRVVDSSASPNIFYATAQVQSGVTVPYPTLTNNKCIWPALGVGLYIPEENKEYPRCFNGRYSFRAKIGKTQKYTARVKLRTIDSLADTAWVTVKIDRKLPTPVIQTISYDATLGYSIIKTNAGRFNFGVLYTLVRTYTDIISTNAGSINLFTNETTSSAIEGSAVYQYHDTGLIDGVTYNYSLTNTDINWAATPTPLSFTSAVVSFETPKPIISTNVTTSSGTCYFNFDARSSYHPANTYQWGYAAGAQGWPGAGSNLPSAPFTTSCTNSSCTASGLVSGTSYYFAVRGTNGIQFGKWSATMLCRPP